MNVGLVLVRVVPGALLFGHGTQKLFGWFGGRGLAATGTGFASNGYRPGATFAFLAGFGEAGGGLLLALGLLTPLGCAAIIGVMLNAIVSVHWPKGIWATNGGFEYPLTLAFVAAGIAFTGPGEFSVDHALGLDPARHRMGVGRRGRRSGLGDRDARDTLQGKAERRRLRPDAGVSRAATTLGVVGTERLVIHGAREHNLRNVTLDLPRDQLIVFTGLSGSGKSSLAFDTIYAEGQRRYVESLSSYARQFLGQMEKPDVDFIEGLSPAISIDQKSTSRNPRSTVGTITEVYDYLRVLFARVGHPHCTNCGRPIGRQTPEQIVDQVMELPEGTKFQVLAPMVRGRKGEYEKLLGDLARKGFPRARIDGEVRELSEPIRLPKNYKHTIEVVVDRLVAKPDIRRRVADSLETALELAEGIAAIAVADARRRRGDPELLARRSRARSAGCRSTSWRPGTSRSTRRTARARRATGSGSSSRSTRSSSSPTPTSRSTRARIAPWASNTLRVLVPRAGGGGRGARRSRSTRRGRSSRRPRATWSSTARTKRSTSATRTGTTGSARTTPPTRGCSRTSSGGTPRPTPTPRARSSSSSCARSRAGRATATACAPRAWPSRSAGSTSRS